MTLRDPVARDARVAACDRAADAYRDIGAYLWTLGFIIGRDRVDRRSRFGYGSDATVGLALVVQSCAELIAGSCVLLKAQNLYGAGALMRQIVETDYLIWAFANAPDVAGEWLRSDRSQRLRFWQPQHCGHAREISSM